VLPKSKRDLYVSYSFVADGRDRFLKGIAEQLRSRLADINATTASESEKQDARKAISCEAAELRKSVEKESNFY
jgi:hypothetical protein